jgi:hypothetical protein
MTNTQIRQRIRRRPNNVKPVAYSRRNANAVLFQQRIDRRQQSARRRVNRPLLRDARFEAVHAVDRDVALVLVAGAIDNVLRGVGEGEAFGEGGGHRS